MSEALRKRLAGDRVQGFWRDIEPHALKNAVFLVREDTELLEVGLALASNDGARVEEWLALNALRRPTAEELSIWRGEPGRIFNILIVQPFVLIQKTELPIAPLGVETEHQETGATLEEIARFAAERDLPPQNES